MNVRNRQEAWNKVNEIFPTDYTENTIKTKNAGYPIYDSNLGDDHGYICDLGNRLEVNLANGKTVNIWIDEKSFTDMPLDEQNEITTLFATWLRPYTHRVIVKVMERRNEIINNEFALTLLRELKKRQDTEDYDFFTSMGCLLSNFDGFKVHDPHNHALTHSNSYRDILYDMYVKNI